MTWYHCPSGICVFVGVDFLYDSLVVATRENGARAGLATAAIAAARRRRAPRRALGPRDGYARRGA